MNDARGTREPLVAANRILTAVRNGNLTALVGGLDHAEQLASHPRQAPSDAAEQLELLGAITTQMQCSIARFRRRLTPHLEGIEVQLRLLRHLARPQPTAVAPPPPNWALPVT